MNPDWTVIAIEGVDAFNFLQGQLTSDMHALSNDQPSLSAYCNQQGRVIATFFLWKQAETIFMALPVSMETIVLHRLKKYALRAKVAFNKLLEVEVPNQSLKAQDLIQNLIPVILPETSEVFVAQRLNLDQLGAISFTKGCYVGQEIVARLHYLGQSKHRLCHLSLNSDEVFAPNTEINNETGAVIGHIVNSIPSQALAVLALEHEQVKTVVINGKELLRT